MTAAHRSRIGIFTRALLAGGIGVTVVALTATVTASMSDDVDGMRGAGVFIVSGLTFTAAGLVIYAVATHGAEFIHAVVEAGTIRRSRTPSNDEDTAPPGDDPESDAPPRPSA